MATWHTIWDFILQWYWLPMLLVYAGIIGTILIENRDPGKSLAYILVLVFLPVIGLVVYYVVGRKPVFKKRVFEKKAVDGPGENAAILPAPSTTDGKAATFVAAGDW